MRVIVLSRFLGKFKTDSWFALPVLLFFFLEILKKKKKLWKWPVNWSISELFYLFFFVPSTLNLKNNSRKWTNKKFWPNCGKQFWSRSGPSCVGPDLDQNCLQRFNISKWDCRQKSAGKKTNRGPVAQCP